MLYSNIDDFDSCKNVVRLVLKENHISVSEDVLNKITKDIMNISYSKGGDYSKTIIKQFAEVYVKRERYLKFI